MNAYKDDHTEIYDLMLQAVDAQLILNKYFFSSSQRITGFILNERKLYVQQATNLIEGTENE